MLYLPCSWGSGSQLIFRITHLSCTPPIFLLVAENRGGFQFSARRVGKTPQVPAVCLPGALPSCAALLRAGRAALRDDLQRRVGRLGRIDRWDGTRLGPVGVAGLQKIWGAMAELMYVKGLAELLLRSV